MTHDPQCLNCGKVTSYVNPQFYSYKIVIESWIAVRMEWLQEVRDIQQCLAQSKHSINRSVAAATSFSEPRLLQMEVTVFYVTDAQKLLVQSKAHSRWPSSIIFCPCLGRGR